MKILVATDGSRAGTAAVRFAAGLLDDSRSGELIILTVESQTAAALRDGLPRRRKSVVEGALKAATTAGGLVRARHQIAFARSADEVPGVISREANRLRVDLIVVGSEGRDSLTEWVVGGTALRLIYVAQRPVTVVRAPRRRRAPG